MQEVQNTFHTQGTGQISFRMPTHYQLCKQQKARYCAECATYGFSELIHWGIQNGCALDREAWIAAATHGHLTLLKWLTSIDCDWHKLGLKGAAENNHFEVLLWAKHFGFQGFFGAAADGAARGGHLTIFDWCCENNSGKGPDFPLSALSGGNLPFLKVLRDRGEDLIHKMALADAARHGNLHVIEWLLDLTDTFDLDWHISESAAVAGSLEILQWAKDHNILMEKRTGSLCDKAAQSGKLEVLKWVREQGFAWDEGTCYKAALVGNIEMLEWVMENGCEYNEVELCLMAAIGVKFEVLKWLKRKGMKSDERVCQMIAYAGNIPMLRWACQNGFEWNKETIFCSAKPGLASLKVLKWLMEEHGVQMKQYEKSLIEHLRIADSIQFWKWAFEHDLVIDHQTLASVIQSKTDPRVVQLLMKVMDHSINNKTSLRKLLARIGQ